MSEAREQYLVGCLSSDICTADDYVDELTNKVNELEQQNKELIETLDIAMDILSDCNYNFILGKEVLEKYK